MRFHKLVFVAVGVALVIVVAVLILPFLIGDDLSYLENEKDAYLIRLEEEPPEETASDVAVSSSAQQATLTKRAVVTRDYVLIGDSRTKGLHQATGIGNTEHFLVIAEVGMGYAWMRDTALPEASGSGISDYVILLGVNDLENIDRYLETYRSLIAQGIRLTLVTVGPVEEGRGGYTLTNYEIDCFNDRLYEVEGAEVIDLNYYLWKHDFSTQDGLHYTEDTYRLIEEFLLIELS